jgi:hypothetical protein
LIKRIILISIFIFISYLTKPAQDRYHIFILTRIHLTHFFGEEKFSMLPSKNKVADEKLKIVNLCASENANFHQPFCF